MELFDVFISYRRSDGAEIADNLYRYLTGKGLRVFLDKEKLEKGDTFPEQLREKIEMTPNYILVATNDVFEFREGVDWVREEIQIAINCHRKHRADRTITTLVFQNTNFPEVNDLPECVHGIEEVERIVVPLNTLEDNLNSNEMQNAFKSVFRVVTKVTGANLWNAAHRWLEQSKSEKGRFSKLNICESILPNVELSADRKDIPILVRQINDNEKRDTKSLFDAIRENNGHLYLIGQGGIGKTTSLMYIMNRTYEEGVYEKGKQIPLFVELSFAPDTYGALYKNEVSSFIRRSIYRQIRTDLKVKQVAFSAIDELDEIFTIEPEIAVNPVTDIFSRKTPSPEYVLLLDGLNEVSTVCLPECNKTILQMVTEEIRYLMEECPNVRIILTSRFDETDIEVKNVTRLYLDGIENDIIRNYLVCHNISDEKIEQIYLNENLVETIKIPLFLTMYVELSEDNEAVSQGEILRLFFNERRKNIDLYTNQDRLEMLEKNVCFAASAIQLNRVTSEMYHFMLDFILPELAWFMEKKGLFYLSNREIRKLIEPILANSDDLSICGDFGREVFSKYRKKGVANIHVDKVAKKMIEVLNENDEKDFRTITENILTCCTVTLGVLQESNQRYGFAHQHIRDYFAAIKNINTIRMARHMYDEGERFLALDCMNSSFYEEPIGLTVRKFMGEYLGEHKNKPYYDVKNVLCYGVPKENEDRCQLDNVLNVYRGFFNQEGGYGVYSILKIILEMRGTLAGGNYSNLDLSRCELNNSGIGMPGIETNVTNAKINGNTLFFWGHRSSMCFIHYSVDGKKIISVGRDGSVYVRDARSGIILKVFDIGEIRFKNDIYVIDADMQLVIVKKDVNSSKICVWNIETGDVENEIELQFEPDGSSMSTDGKRLLLWENRNVYIWTYGDLSPIKVGFTPQRTNISYCMAVDDGRRILIGIQDARCDKEEMIDVDIWMQIWKDSLAFIHRQCKNAIVIWDIENEVLIEHSPSVNGKVIELGESHGNLFQIIQYEDDKFSVEVTTKENTERRLILYLNDNNRIGKLFGAPYHDVKFSDTGKWFAIANEKTLKIYETINFKLVKTLIFKHDILGISFCDTSNRFVIYTRDGEIQVYNTDYFESVLRIDAAGSSITHLKYLDGENKIATYCENGDVLIWNVDEKRLEYQKKISPEEYATVRLTFDYPDHPYKTKLNMQIDEEWDILQGKRYIIITKGEGTKEKYVMSIDYELMKYILNAQQNELAVQASDDGIVVFSLSNESIEQLVTEKWKFSYEPGLDVLGLDLRNLHPESIFADWQKEMLYTYGAIIE